MLHLNRPHYVIALAAALWLAPFVSAVRAEPRASRTATDGSAATISERPNQVRGDEITPQQQKAVEAGLVYLASRRPGAGASESPPGITALQGLAFMQAGNLPGRGRFGKEVAERLQYVMNSCQQSGLIANDAGSGSMYGHGFATLFLGEVYGMTGDDEVKEKLQRAVRLIQKTQNPQGGWRYTPVPLDADISVTICQVMALRAARDAGIKVEKEVIDRSIRYVRSCQNGDGGFSYQPGMSNSGFGRTAAGVASLYYAGIFEGNELARGLDYLSRFPTGGAPGQGVEGMYFYANYYAVQAMFLAGGDYWAKFYPTVRDQLIARQDKDGSWTGEAGPEYATAMALIILQMPNRYLPVYAGKGPGS